MRGLFQFRTVGAMRRPPDRSRLFLFLMAAALVAALVAIAVSRTGSAPPVASSAPEPTLPPTTLFNPADPDATVRQAVFLDGWSAATIADRTVLFDDIEQVYTGAYEPEQLRRVEFVPATTAIVEQLAAETPGLLELVAARMITMDPDVTCDAEGCRSASGPIPFDWFTDAAQIPTYGDSYQAWGIESALLVAETEMSVEATSVLLRVEGFADLEILRALPMDPDDPDAIDRDPDPSAATRAFGGFEQNRYLIAAGLGRLFVPEPAWLAEEGRHNFKSPALELVPAAGDPVNALGTVSELTPFSGGLAGGYHPGLTAALTRSQMTWMTSPTTGCGLGVLCVPATGAATVSDAATVPQTVCRADGAPFGTLVLSEATWAIDGTRPFHQTGLWSGVAPDSFEGRPDGVEVGPNLWAGRPPLVAGDAVARVQVGWLFYGPVEGSRLIDLAGRVAHVGFDEPGTVVIADLVDGFARYDLTVCASPSESTSGGPGSSAGDPGGGYIGVVGPDDLPSVPDEMVVGNTGGLDGDQVGADPLAPVGTDENL